uniref:Paraneoplastic antigen Ma-like N-terminal domain-containing protein n=1 Tax=Monopterus albus TaxID=43700 RepID=A0A3Q3J050_MONAL
MAVVLTAENWCRGETLDETHAFLTIVPENTEIFTIEETLQTIKCLGRVRVTGRMLTDFADPSSGVLVLCECKGDVSKSAVPSEISLSLVSPVCFSPPSLLTFIYLDFAERKSMADVQALLPDTLPASSPTKSVLCAVGGLLDKTNRSSESGGYRRLRMFSGMVPTPVGEEQFNHWLEQAYLMGEESEGSPKDKRLSTHHLLSDTCPCASLHCSRPTIHFACDLKVGWECTLSLVCVRVKLYVYVSLFPARVWIKAIQYTAEARV